MVLEYKFKYTSNNNSFISIVDRVMTKKSTSYKLYREKEFIFLYIEDEEDRLLKISNELS